jgi:hypothetical protein
MPTQAEPIRRGPDRAATASNCGDHIVNGWSFDADHHTGKIAHRRPSTPVEPG